MALKLSAGFNQYLPTAAEGSTATMQAVITVVAEGEANLTAPATGPVPVNIGLVIDVSGSMIGEKMEAACEAASAAVGAFGPHVNFVVVAFNTAATNVFGPTAATPDAIRLAQQRIRKLIARGGTAMSTGLIEVLAAFNESDRPGRILFLTDGQNQDEPEEALLRALDELAQARIPVTAWGVGDGWDVDELQAVARRTGGTADGIPEPSEMRDMLTEAVSSATNTAFSNVRLRLRTFQGGRITRIQQAFPEFAELTLSQREERVAEVYVGSLAKGETRDYLVELELTVQAPDQPFLVLRPSAVHAAGGEDAEVSAPREGWVFAQWSANSSLTATIHPTVAHYTGQSELSSLITEGMSALNNGNASRATQLLGQAMEKAEKSRNTQLLSTLSKVIQRDANGTVRLSPTSDAGARKTLSLRSGKTARLQ